MRPHVPSSALAAQARERVALTIKASTRHVAAAAITQPKEPRAQLLALSTRHIADWSPDDVSCAMSQASSGSLTAAADFVQAIMHDDRAAGVMSTRTLGMLGLPLEWESGEPEGWYVLAPEAELNLLMQWGFFLGVGIARVKPDGALETWHMRWFRVDTTTGQWYVTTSEGEKPIEFGTGEWVMFAPYGSIEPYFRGLWLTLAVPFLTKRYAVHDRARASEVFGSAMIVGNAPEGSSEERRNRWLTELRSLARSARIVLPEGYSVDLLEAQGQTWGIYAQSTEWADEAITIAIAGQLVTTEGGSGWSRGDIHQKIALSLVKFGAQAFSTCLATQYVQPVWGTLSYPQWQVDPPEAIASVSAAYEAFGKAVKTFNEAVAGEDIKLDVITLASKFGIPVAKVPPKAVKTVPIAFAPTDIAKFVTKDEGRASIGLEPLPDGAGTAFVAPPEPGEAGAVMPDATLPTAGATDAEEADADIEASALYDEAVANADSFNKRAIDSCRHGKKNICRICRLRRRTLADDGSPDWGPQSTEWVAMGAPRQIAASAVNVMPGHRRARMICKASLDSVPEKFVVFEPGENVTDHGTVYWTKRSIAIVTKLLGSREVMIDLEHLSLDPKAKNYDPNARGWARYSIGPRGELIATSVRWTSDGTKRLKEKTQRFISPAFDIDTKTGEIVRLINLALTALPAMHHAPPLIAASQTGGNVMNEILAKLGLPETATLADVLAAIAAMQEQLASAADAAGAKKTADAATDAAEASAAAAETAGSETVEQPVAAAAAAPAPTNGPPEKEEPIAARVAASAAGGSELLTKLIARVDALETRDETRERATLLASRTFKPWEKTMLAGMSLEGIRTYLAHAPAAAAHTPPARTQAAVPNDSVAAVAKATGLPVDKVRSYNGG